MVVGYPSLAPLFANALGGNYLNEEYTFWKKVQDYNPGILEFINSAY